MRGGRNDADGEEFVYCNNHYDIGVRRRIISTDILGTPKVGEWQQDGKDEQRDQRKIGII